MLAKFEPSSPPELGLLSSSSFQPRANQVLPVSIAVCRSASALVPRSIGPPDTTAQVTPVAYAVPFPISFQSICASALGDAFVPPTV